MRALLLGLLVSLPCGGAHAFDLPGLGLDNPGLADLSFGNYQGFGAVAAVKGARTGYLTSEVIGRLRAGQFPATGRPLDYRFPTYSGAVPLGSTSQLSDTLVPPFALGVVGLVTYFDTNIGRMFGPFVQAVVYEPDQVKRKGGPGEKARLQMKQNDYLAFRFGQFRGTGFGYPQTLSRGIQIADCKAQVDIKSDPIKDAPAKMKVKCSGKSAAVEDLKNRLGLILGKPKSGFSLTAKIGP